MGNNNKLNVLYFFSEVFADVAATSIVSLLENNKSFDGITVYIIDDSISKQKREKLSRLVSSYNRNIVYINAPDPVGFFNFPFKSRYQMGHSYMRMCIGSLVPDSVEKILCLDSDTLVLGDLTRLWETDMKDNILAGVADCVNIKAFRKQFMLNKNDIYCNAGMFLVNLKEWRKCNIEDKIRETIKKHNGNIFFFEQTLMNYVCRGRIIKLPPEYNSFTLFYAMSYKNLMIWRRPTNYYTEEQSLKAKQSPVIIHFTRNFYMMSRPWIKGCDHPMTNEYVKYKQMTPWKALVDDKRSWSKKMRYKLIHVLPQRLIVLITTILYNDIRPLLFWKNE